MLGLFKLYGHWYMAFNTDFGYTPCVQDNRFVQLPAVNAGFGWHPFNDEEIIFTAAVELLGLMEQPDNAVDLDNSMAQLFPSFQELPKDIDNWVFLVEPSQFVKDFFGVK